MSAAAPRPVRTRFAPSPTGLPHVGNFRNALYSWLLARRHGGQFLFRLEDTDRERYDPASEQALKDALAWFGLDYDEGPGVGGPHAPYEQSRRLASYRTVAEQLIASGHAYRCFCTRERIQAVREARQKANIHPHGYDRHCRGLTHAEAAHLLDSGAPSVVRFAVPSEGDTLLQDAVRGRISYPNRELDDHVLLKSDGFPTYHLAHMVDDRTMEISHVIRSEEWLPSTPRHVLQHQALGWEPPIYVHPGLILGRDPQSGKTAKLSKRHGAVHMGEYRAQGYLPDALANFVALLGWSPGGDREIMSRAEMVSLFSLEGINSSPSVFDSDKLNWMNGVYVRALSETDLLDNALPFLAEAGLTAADPGPEERRYVTQVLRLEQERLKTLSAAAPATAFFFGELPEYEEAAVRKRLQTPGAAAALDAVRVCLNEAADWSVSGIENAVRTAADTLGVKPADVIHPTRVAATGRTAGPGLFETLEALGRERVLHRLRHARATWCRVSGAQ